MQQPTTAGRPMRVVGRGGPHVSGISAIGLRKRGVVDSLLQDSSRGDGFANIGRWQHIWWGDGLGSVGDVGGRGSGYRSGRRRFVDLVDGEQRRGCGRRSIGPQFFLCLKSSGEISASPKSL